MSDRTKDVTLEGVTYRVRGPSAAEYGLFMRTFVDGKKAAGITVEALEAQERTHQVILQRAVLSPTLTEERALELAQDSIAGTALISTILGLSLRQPDKPKGKPGKGKSEKEPDAA